MEEVFAVSPFTPRASRNWTRRDRWRRAPLVCRGATTPRPSKRSNQRIYGQPGKTRL